jgi:hypothetical protein
VTKFDELGRSSTPSGIFSQLKDNKKSQMILKINSEQQTS